MPSPLRNVCRMYYTLVPKWSDCKLIFLNENVNYFDYLKTYVKHDSYVFTGKLFFSSKLCHFD
jgi:hypothetical protein